jgi:hypothetical protein
MKQTFLPHDHDFRLENNINIDLTQKYDLLVETGLSVLQRLMASLYKHCNQTLVLKEKEKKPGIYLTFSRNSLHHELESILTIPYHYHVRHHKIFIQPTFFYSGSTTKLTIGQGTSNVSRQWAVYVLIPQETKC